MELCPNCGETCFISIGSDTYYLHCETCDYEWTMTESEIYDLSFPSPIVKEIVKKLNALAYKMAMELDDG